MIRLEDVLKMSWRRFCKTSWRCLEDVFARRLEDVLKTFWRRLGKTSWRCLEDVLKTSWRRLENVLKTSWRRIAKTNILVLTKTSWIRLHQDECLLGSLLKLLLNLRISSNNSLLLLFFSAILIWKLGTIRKRSFLSILSKDSSVYSDIVDGWCSYKAKVR